jgi:hypothetical protein
VNLAGTTVDLRVAGAALRDSSASEYYREQDKLLLGQKNHVIEGTHVFLAVMSHATAYYAKKKIPRLHGLCMTA